MLIRGGGLYVGVDADNVPGSGAVVGPLFAPSLSRSEMAFDVTALPPLVSADTASLAAASFALRAAAKAASFDGFPEPPNIRGCSRTIVGDKVVIISAGTPVHGMPLKGDEVERVGISCSVPSILCGRVHDD